MTDASIVAERLPANEARAATVVFVVCRLSAAAKADIEAGMAFEIALETDAANGEADAVSCFAAEIDSAAAKDAIAAPGLLINVADRLNVAANADIEADRDFATDFVVAAANPAIAAV